MALLDAHARATGLALRRERIRLAHVPAARRGNLRLATWNIRQLGDGARLDESIRSARDLGAAKQYSHEIEMEGESGTIAWLRQFPIEGEPGRDAIPQPLVPFFNSLIRTVTTRQVRRVR